jgi:CRP-like cAMP-binding protein
VALVDGQAACGWWQGERGLAAERVLHAPAWLALAGPWVDGPTAATRVAQTAVLLAELPLEPLRMLLTRHPMLALRFTDALAREVGRLEVAPARADAQGRRRTPGGLDLRPVRRPRRSPRCCAWPSASATSRRSWA